MAEVVSVTPNTDIAIHDELTLMAINRAWNGDQAGAMAALEATRGKNPRHALVYCEAAWSQAMLAG
jgi:hypothetical protein